MSLVIVGWRMLGLPIPSFLLTLVLGHERGQKEQRVGPWPLTRFPAVGEGTAAVIPCPMLPSDAVLSSAMCGRGQTRQTYC